MLAYMMTLMNYMTSMHCIQTNYLVRYFAQMNSGYGIIRQDTT